MQSQKPQLTDPEIEALVGKSQRGDSESFGKIYDLFVGPIYRYLYYRVGAEEAEDLTELVFLKTWESIRSYRPKRRFSAWLFRIAHNITVDFYRSNHFKDELSEDIPDLRIEANSIERAHRHFDQQILGQAMKELKDHYRQILILKYMNDLSNEEIAQIMGRSQAALRILQFRALKSLKRVLEKMGISDF
ncbi:sigma-70 family RNA polymerase sigma factor [Candidatus Peregrinibacteria bacterium]|nr:sigma-70 family RNA polymerase sigma factor [Candidatus Peregrinibacteria bacterium]